MAYKRFTNVGDIIRHRRNALIRCPCGRESVLNPFELQAWCMLHGWPTDFGRLSQRLKCVECGKPGASIGNCGAPADFSLAHIARERMETHTAKAEQYRTFAQQFGAIPVIVEDKSHYIFPDFDALKSWREALPNTGLETSHPSRKKR